MTLIEALDPVYGHKHWHNPIHPFFVSGVIQTPFQAYQELKQEYQEIVNRLIGHVPAKDEE